VIHRVPAFTIRTPQLLGAETEREYVHLSSKVVRYRADADEVARTLKLALSGGPLIVAIFESQAGKAVGNAERKETPTVGG